MKHNQNSFG